MLGIGDFLFLNYWVDGRFHIDETPSPPCNRMAWETLSIVETCSIRPPTPEVPWPTQ
jgi:hypothetical protein